MAGSQAYLLVYHISSKLAGDLWVDKGNDPDLRRAPMTWGICRTNVRNWARIGADLFFLAYHEDGHRRPLEDRYYLSARFRVDERIGHDKAVRRFPGRPNVILDRLPPGPSLAERLHKYLVGHAEDLAWDEKEQIQHDLAAGTGEVRWRAEDYTVRIGDEWYVHANWDHHPDWRRRLTAPYLVADGVESKRLQTPIRYADCVARCQSLPSLDSLQTPRWWRHPARHLPHDAVSYLLARVQMA